MAAILSRPKHAQCVKTDLFDKFKHYQAEFIL